MSRRRRKGNPLLMRCILISIGANLIILPILGYFGAFKNIAVLIHKPVDIVMLPPPKIQDKEEMKKQAPKKVAAKGPGAKKSGGPKGKPLSQHVVAPPASAGSSDSGSGPEIVNPDKGAAPGTLPTAPSSAGNSKGPGNGDNNLVANSKPAPQPEPIPKPTPAPEAAPKPHVPVVTDVAATYSPEPSIPDDLRDADLDTKVTAQVMVSPQGSPTDVKIVQSSGNEELDSLALDTAKKWRFKAATRDGVAIESRVMLHIEFQVQ
jgi:protein TonB